MGTHHRHGRNLAGLRRLLLLLARSTLLPASVHRRRGRLRRERRPPPLEWARVRSGRNNPALQRHVPARPECLALLLGGEGAVQHYPPGRVRRGQLLLRAPRARAPGLLVALRRRFNHCPRPLFVRTTEPRGQLPRPLHRPQPVAVRLQRLPHPRGRTGPPARARRAHSAPAREWWKL